MRRFTRHLNPARMDKSGESDPSFRAHDFYPFFFLFFFIFSRMLVRVDAWRRERKLRHSIIYITATKKYSGLITDESLVRSANFSIAPNYQSYCRGYYCSASYSPVSSNVQWPTPRTPSWHNLNRGWWTDSNRTSKYPKNLFHLDDENVLAIMLLELD